MESSKKTQTIVGELRDIATKALLFIVAISFVLWGINGGSGLTDMDWVIKVDGVKFSYDQWRGLLHDTERAEDQEDQDGKHAVSGTKGSRSMRQQLIGQVVDRMVLLQEAKRLGIFISDEQLKRALSAEKAFQGKHGKFSKSAFHRATHSTSSTDSIVLDKLRERMIIEQVIQMFIQQSPPSPQFRNMVMRAMYVQHVMDVYRVSSQDVNLKVQTPTDAELREFVRHNSKFFSTPEMRDYYYFVLSADMLPKGAVTVTEDEVRDAYQSKRLLYSTEETRDVERIVLGSEADALKLRNDITSNVHNNDAASRFKTAARNSSLFPKQVQLKNVKRKSFSEKITNTIFALHKGEISMPIETPNGWCLFRLTQITPQRTKNFQEVHDSLNEALLNEKSFNALSVMVNDVEHDLKQNNSYDNFINTAKKYGISVRFAKGAVKGSGATTIDSHDATTHSAIDAVKREINDTAFSIASHEISSVIPIVSNGSFVSVYVERVQPSGVQDFSSVRSEAIKKWQQERRDFILSQVAYLKREAIRDAVAHNVGTNNNESDSGYTETDVKHTTVQGMMSDKNSSAALESPQGSERMHTLTNLETDTARSNNSLSDGLSEYVKQVHPTEIVFTRNEPLPLNLGIPRPLYKDSIKSTQNNSLSDIYYCEGKSSECYMFAHTKDIRYPTQEEMEKLYTKQQLDITRIYQTMLIEEYTRSVRTHHKIEVRYDALDIDVN